MRIAFVFAYALGIGGHFRSGLGMAQHLIEAGHQVVVLAPGAADEVHRDYLAAGAHVTIVPGLANRRPIPRPLLARRLLSSIGETPQIVHAQDPQSIGPALLAAVFARASFVLTVAGGPLSAVPPPRDCETISFSRELLDRIQADYDLLSEHLHLNRARIDMRTYRAVERNPAFRARYRLPDTGKTILIAMRLDEPKRPWLNTLLEAAEALAQLDQDVRIVIAGEGPMAAELRETETLLPIGPVFSVDDMNQLYNEADLVIGSGRGILEAMACRKPVVILGESGEGELVEADNVEAIAYANFSGRHFRDRGGAHELRELLVRLVQDEEALDRTADFSYEYVRNEMDAALGAEHLLEIYQKATDRPATITDFLSWNTKALTNSAHQRLRPKRP